MRIIGFSFKKISAERKKDIKGKLEIKSNMNIENIEKDNIDIAGDILKFSYTYSIFYEPGFAEITFQGTILVVPDKSEDLKKILKDWKNKKLSEEIRIFLYNFIMTKCNLKALQLEEDFTLPAHLPLPKLTKQTQEGQPAGQANYAG